MVEVLLKTLGAALSLWEHEEKTKYLDLLIELRRNYYAEFNKPLDLRSDAALDQLEFELRLVALAFASSAGKQDTPD